ncbi:MAG TPA: sulfite exporter TauE/SafE family protein [Acidimicrobiales bacterium]|nr:sulfite exporter TauE/SafE family protein [Acidimicrobiales bacterium]
MELTLVALVAAMVATLAGAAIQGSIGFGMNLVTVPVLALLVPEALPVAVILLGLPISVTMLRHERAAVDRAGVMWIICGRLPGSAVGAWVAATVAVETLQQLVGVVILCFVIASIAMPPVPVRRGTQVLTGAVSGVTGTAAGIGGPPLALLYQHHTGPTMRSTLAASFFVGTFVSMVALGIAGAVGAGPVLLGLVLAPVVVLGSHFGRRSHAFLARGWLRSAVLVFSAVSAAVVIADSLT